MNGARREFGVALGALAAMLISASCRAQMATSPPILHRPARSHGNRRMLLPLVKPRALRHGDVVGLIAPGGVVDDAIINKCVGNLEALGFKVKVGKNIRAARGGYAGTVAQRLDDLHGMFLDNEVKAIWTARGGSGCAAILPGIQYAMIRRQAKILIGYSDITALHLALNRYSRIVTYHGPVAWSTPNDYAISQMQAVLMAPRPQTEIHLSIENERRAESQSEFAVRIIRGGVAEGRLIGGNLSVLAALIGTPYAAEIKNHLLFLEDVGEAPYRVDRMLTQLQQSEGRTGNLRGLDQAAGVMLGVFRRSSAPADDPSLTLDEVLDDHFARSAVSAVYGYSFGHIPQQFTIPMGVRARLDTNNKTLLLLESAVEG